MILRNSVATETKEKFIENFDQDAAALELHPDAELRRSVAEGLWEHREIFNNSKATNWPRSFSCRFIEPGLVHYADYGMVLVQKNVLDKMQNSFVGKPVVNVIHKDVEPGKFREEADGVVTRVWYNESDGWYWAEFLVWDKATVLNCMSPAYSVSCAYAVTNQDDKPGEYHSIPYQKEVIDGEYNHLAIVSNPRYEGARIVYNSKGGSMKIFNFFKKGEAKKQPADVEKAVVDVDGKQVSVKELFDVFNAREAAGKPTGEVTLDNMSDDTIIEIDGKEMPLKNLKDAYRKNAADEEEKKKKEEADLKNAEDEEKKKKEAENRKNAEDEEEKKKKDLENAKAAEEAAKGTQHFNNLRDAANRRGEPQQPVLTSRRELAALGKERYGEVKK
jgi:hypothetical protein